MRSAVGSMAFWLGCALAFGCQEKKAGGPTAAASTRPVSAPSVASASAPASAASEPSASASAESRNAAIVGGSSARPSLPRAPAEMGALEVLRSERAGLVLLIAEDDAHATIVNEKTGEWRLVKPRREGETRVLETAGAKLSITGVGPKRQLAVSFGASAARTFDTAIVKLLPHSPPGAAFTVDGEGLSSAALASLPRVMLGKTPMIWREGFLPASPSLPTPTKLALGGRVIEPTPLVFRREGRCSIVGICPRADGQLGEALATAQKATIDSVCQTRADATLIEASYALVRFKGVNLEEGREPDPTDVVGLDLVLRVTDAWGSTLIETGHLAGLAKGEVSSLSALLKPTGAAFLEKKALDPYYVAPPQLAAFSPRERAALLDLSRASLVLGPSTIDVVIPAEPLGLFLGQRRVRLGPRSDLAPAFVNGPLTQRLVAAVMVDY